MHSSLTWRPSPTPIPTSASASCPMRYLCKCFSSQILRTTSFSSSSTSSSYSCSRCFHAACASNRRLDWSTSSLTTHLLPCVITRVSMNVKRRRGRLVACSCPTCFPPRNPFLPLPQHWGSPTTPPLWCTMEKGSSRLPAPGGNVSDPLLFLSWDHKIRSHHPISDQQTACRSTCRSPPFPVPSRFPFLSLQLSLPLFSSQDVPYIRSRVGVGPLGRSPPLPLPPPSRGGRGGGTL